MIPAPLAGYALIGKIIGGVILIAAAWYAWHSFTNHYVQIGRMERQPEIDALITDKQTLQNSYAMLGLEVEKQNKQVQELKQVSERYAQKAVQAEKKAKAIAEHIQEKINAAESSPVAATCEDAVKEAQARL